MEVKEAWSLLLEYLERPMLSRQEPRAGEGQQELGKEPR